MSKISIFLTDLLRSAEYNLSDVPQMLVLSCCDIKDHTLKTLCDLTDGNYRAEVKDILMKFLKQFHYGDVRDVKQYINI